MKCQSFGNPYSPVFWFKGGNLIVHLIGTVPSIITDYLFFLLHRLLPLLLIRPNSFCGNNVCGKNEQLEVGVASREEISESLHSVL